MKLRSKALLLLAASLGLASSSYAQLINLNLSQRTTFSSFVGGINNSVTNNGTFNTVEVVSTGTPTASPFTITFTPLVGPQSVQLNTGTLSTATFAFNSSVNPLNYFSSVAVKREVDFDSNGIIDLVQNYTLTLSPFSSPNGFTGVNYSIVPLELSGNVLINGITYGYASVVSGSSGTLFDGSNATAAIQTQFIFPPFASVPEPATYGLIGALALAGVVAVRRRR